MARYVWRVRVSQNGFPPFKLHMQSTCDITQASLDALAMLDARYGSDKDEARGGGRWTAAESGYELVGLTRILELDDTDDDEDI